MAQRASCTSNTSGPRCAGFRRAPTRKLNRGGACVPLLLGQADAVGGRLAPRDSQPTPSAARAKVRVGSAQPAHGSGRGRRRRGCADRGPTGHREDRAAGRGLRTSPRARHADGAGPAEGSLRAGFLGGSCAVSSSRAWRPRRRRSGGVSWAARPNLRASLSARGASASSDCGRALGAALHGLYWLAANTAARQPLLIAVDDAHWADMPSLRWLAYLAVRVEDLPVLVSRYGPAAWRRCAFREPRDHRAGGD